MKYKIIFLFIVAIPLLSKAQITREDFERGLQQMEQQGKIRREGTKIIVLHMNAGDTAFSRELYNSMLANVDQSKNPYSIAFEVDKQPVKNLPVKIKTLPKKDSTVTMVYSPPLQQANHNFRIFQFIQNGDFEMGANRTIPGWKIQGRSFIQKTGADIYTWEDVEVVSKTTVGGDYWEDLKFNLGNRHARWMSSRGEGVYGNDYYRFGTATGTLTSMPFKIYADQNFISFLISGGNDPANLKAELLECSIGPRLSGSNVGAVLTGVHAAPGVHLGSVSTVIDTFYKTIPGIEAKTGHNNHIFRREWWEVSQLDTSKLYAIRVTDNSQKP